MKILISKLLFIALISSCAQVTSVNLKKHQFGQQPNKIIWFQIAGLSEEHIALLKFSNPNAESLTSFEEFMCYGKTWDYSIYKLRNESYSGFLSQLTGKKNIRNTCQDYEHKPVWRYLTQGNYKTGVIENLSSESESLQNYKQCKDASNYTSGTVFWKMHKPPQGYKNFFHMNEDTDFKTDEVYYDRSCKSGECYSLFSDNVISTYERHFSNKRNFLFLIRDFRFLNSLKIKNIQKSKAVLSELDKTIRFFQSKTKRNNDMLFIVTSAEAKGTELPLSGKQWGQFEKNGKYIHYKNGKLMGAVFAVGARAENFCGIYNQSDLLTRIFSGPKQQGLEFTFLNPFN